MGKLGKLTVTLILVAIAMVCIVKIMPYSTSEQKNMHVVQQIDREIDNVMKLTAGATAVSAALSLLPDDACTPIAQEFAEVSKYFIVISSALFLEKYLVAIMGYVSFGILIPIACILLIVGIWADAEKCKRLSAKLAILALVFYFIIPISVYSSEKIYNTYESNITDTLNTADEVSVVDENATAIGKFVSWIENAVGSMVDFATDLLSNFVEAIAVMIVTSCIIPVLTFIIAMWIVKVIIGSSNFMTGTDSKILFKHINIEENKKTI